MEEKRPKGRPIIFQIQDVKALVEVDDYSKIKYIEFERGWDYHDKVQSLGVMTFRKRFYILFMKMFYKFLY